MLSTAGKAFDRTKIIRPMPKQERLRNYSSGQVKTHPKKGISKFSPFNTVSRTSRNSYLLRVTCQPNTKTNYQLNWRHTLPVHRRATIDKAGFKRIIGNVKDESYQKPLKSESKLKCMRANSTELQKGVPKPLTVRDCQTWRKTFQHYDFDKMPESRAQIEFRKKAQSSRAPFFNGVDNLTMRSTIESQFENFNRFSMRPNPERAHQFDSDSPHQYLKKEQQRRSPEYDTSNSKEQIIRRSLGKPKGESRFYMFREKITSRKDRADPLWNTQLQYEPNVEYSYTGNSKRTIDLDKTIDREQNLNNSKYPIRLSLQKISSKRSDV